MRRRRKWNRWSTWKRLLTVLIGSTLGLVLLYVIARVVEGIVGNRADAWLGLSAVDWFLEPLTTYRLVPFAVGFLVIAVCLDRFFRVNEERARRERSHSVMELNLTAQTAIAKMASEIDDLEDNIQKTLTKLLEDIILAFPGETFRAAILRPDSKRHFLQVWQQVGMDPDHLPNDCFCIMNPRNAEDQPGVAGTAWRTRIPQFSHVFREEGVDRGDHPAFIPTREGTGPLIYQSIAQIPLIGPNRSLLGVLTCDSKQWDTFDDSVDREMLVNMGAVISRTIVIYLTLRALRERLRGQDQTAAPATTVTRLNNRVANGTPVPLQTEVGVVISGRGHGNSGNRAPIASDMRRQVARVRRAKTEVDKIVEVQGRADRREGRPPLERHG